MRRDIQVTTLGVDDNGKGYTCKGGKSVKRVLNAFLKERSYLKRKNLLSFGVKRNQQYLGILNYGISSILKIGLVINHQYFGYLSSVSIWLNNMYFMLSHGRQSIPWNNPCHKNHITTRVITPARLVSLITLINIRIIPLIDSNKDGVRVRQHNFHFWNSSCLQFWDYFVMNDKCQTDGRVRHITITMWILRLPEIFMVVKIRCFPATYLEALSTSMLSNIQWKKIPPPKIAFEISWLRQYINVSN